MPIIIWGSRGITSTLEDGIFFCPQCNRRSEYDLKQSRPFFTLFFIPLFPIGGAERYIECNRCQGTFREEVLDYGPDNETDRILTDLYHDLRAGASWDDTKKKLIALDMEPDRAEKLLFKMCDEQPRECSCGQRFHPDARNCSSCGGRL